jgi:hypothetical protein
MVGGKMPDWDAWKPAEILDSGIDLAGSSPATRKLPRIPLDRFQDNRKAGLVIQPTWIVDILLT